MTKPKPNYHLHAAAVATRTIITVPIVPDAPLASDGLEGWPRRVRLIAAFERALRRAESEPPSVNKGEK